MNKRTANTRMLPFLLCFLLLFSAPAESQVNPANNSCQRQFSLTLGAEESVPFGDLKWCPDTHVSYIKNRNQFYVWVTGGLQTGGYSYRFQGTSFYPLTANPSQNGQPVPVLSPNPAGTFDRDYAGLSAVIAGRHEHELIGIYHAEYHPQAPSNIPALASIGLALSEDDGQTWNNREQIITGIQNQIVNDTIVTGAGEPSAVIRRSGYIYVYFSDANSLRSPAIYVARAPINMIENTRAWQKWNGNTWGTPGDMTDAAPVISFPNDIAVQAQISFNIALGRYIAVFASQDGFQIATSIDGIHFDTPQMILPFPVPRNQLQKGDVFLFYPTLLSPDDMPSQQVTSMHGYLYYAKGLYKTSPHYGARRSFRIQLN